ncbi:MAG: hemolysin family protein [Actinomycetota bacterium]
MELVIIGILILLNGLFALSEIALVSSKGTRLEQLRSEGRKGAVKALELQKNSENFLSSVQVGITLIGIITGAYGGVSVAEDVIPLLVQIGIPAGSADEIAMVVTVIVITYFSIVIGELVPKTIALNNPEKIAVRIAPFIYYFSRLFYPFVWLLAGSTAVVNRILGIKKVTSQITETELRHILKSASTDGVIEKEQTQINERLFYFADKRVRHIMVPRPDIEWIDLDDSQENIRKAVMESKHSKLICSREDLDNFQGLLYTKDYLRELSESGIADAASLLADPLIVPETMEAVKLWRLFQQKHFYTAVVVNEYGSLEGIITLHDIMENIIGDIPEEGEESEPDIFVRDDKSYLISGDAAVEVLDGIIDGFKINFEEADYSTVAGFVLSRINKIPQIGDKFKFVGHTIEIIDIDGNRIDKVLIVKD